MDFQRFLFFSQLNLIHIKLESIHLTFPDFIMIILHHILLHQIQRYK